MISALLALTLAQDPISSIAENELDDTIRIKRSGTSIISTLQKNVFGASAQLSAGSSSSVTNGIAGLSSGSSSGSSSGHESGHGYETGHSYEESHVSNILKQKHNTNNNTVVNTIKKIIICNAIEFLQCSNYFYLF